MSQDRVEALSRSLADSTSRRSLLRLLGVGVAGTAITAVGLTEGKAARKKARKQKVRSEATAGALIKAITGTVVGLAGSTVSGTFTLTRFAVQDGQLVAIGTYSGVIKDAAGNILAHGTQTITLPVTNISGTCKILHLELGPLDLNLLGLQVHLDKVVLDITAQSGPGQLLGNLLCAIANLLNNPGRALNQLVDLLNRLLRLLG